MSARIRVEGGPWPERVGCEGVTVDDPGDGIYPFDKPLRGHVVILLDDDPLSSRKRGWTCTLAKRDLLYLPPCRENGATR